MREVPVRGDAPVLSLGLRVPGRRALVVGLERRARTPWSCPRVGVGRYWVAAHETKVAVAHSDIVPVPSCSQRGWCARVGRQRRQTLEFEQKTSIPGQPGPAASRQGSSCPPSNDLKTSYWTDHRREPGYGRLGRGGCSWLGRSRWHLIQQRAQP